MKQNALCSNRANPLFFLSKCLNQALSLRTCQRALWRFMHSYLSQIVCFASPNRITFTESGTVMSH
jgi:hypothetical protein